MADGRRARRSGTDASPAVRPTPCSPTPSACRSIAGCGPTTSPAREPTSAACSGPGCSPTTRSTAILGALDQVADELADDTFTFVQSDEDIHTAVERRVTELAGAAGGKLHTARSRNDQIATDLRLWCKRELIEVARLVVALEDILLARAEAAGDTYLPGYTHVQRAQPVLLAHHLLAHGWAFGPRRRPPRRHRRAPRRLAARGRRAGRHVAADRSGGHRDRPRVRRRVRQLAGRRQRPRLRRRGAVRPGDGRHPPGSHRRGVGAVDERGVRLRPPRRRLRDRLVDDAAEEERRHRRAGARQVGAPDRQPHRAAGDAEGPAALLQPRPAGGQGAAVRLGRPDLAGPRGHRRDDRDGDVRARTDGRGGRQRDDVGHRSRRVARRAGHAVPRGPRRRRRAGAQPPVVGHARCASSSPRTSGSGPDAAALLAPGSPSSAAPHRVAAARGRSPTRSSATASRCAASARRSPGDPVAERVVEPRLPRPGCARGRARAAGQGAGQRAVRRAHRRGRGVPLRRAGRPLVPRPDAAQPDHVRAGRAPLRVLHLRDAPLRQRRHRRRR